MNVVDYEVKQIEISGNTYFVRPFPPLQALDLLGDLQSVVTADLEGGEVTTSSLLSSIGKNLNGTTLVKFANRILDKECVAVQRAGDDEPAKLDTNMQGIIFTGKVMDMLKLMKFILEVNYADFFATIGNLSGSATK